MVSMKIWIYRPDKEALERQINKNFTYNCNNKSYWDCYDDEKENKAELKKLKEIRYKSICKTKIEA